MNLREDIADTILNIPCTNAFTLNDFNRTLDEIISKIEKRIDEVFMKPDHGILDIYNDIKEILK